MKTPTAKEIIKAINQVKKEKGEVKKEVKPFNELYTVEDWIDYYEDAGRMELKSRLKSLGNNWLDTRKKNEKKAIEALLY